MVSVVYWPPFMSTPDAATRLRQRVARLLEDRGMTQRIFAKKVGHGDQWASNFLTGRNDLTWDDVDRVASALGVPPGELIRVSDEPWELMPTEMRLLRASRMLPQVLRDHLVMHAEFLIGNLPDDVERQSLLRRLTEEELARVDEYIRVTILAKDAVRRTTTPEGYPIEGPAQVEIDPDAKTRKNG